MKGNNGSAQNTPGAKGTRIHFKITQIEDLERRLVKVSRAGVKNGYSSTICNIIRLVKYFQVLFYFKENVFIY